MNCSSTTLLEICNEDVDKTDNGNIGGVGCKGRGVVVVLIMKMGS